MVKLLIGHKGSGKTKKMIDMANSSLDAVNGSVVFINKNSRLTYDLKYTIRVICMEDYEQIKNVDEYIGFIYGVISQDHDIELLFIDSILKHAEIKPEDIPGFLERLDVISTAHGMDIIVSISAEMEELGIDTNKYTVLN